MEDVARYECWRKPKEGTESGHVSPGREERLGREGSLGRLDGGMGKSWGDSEGCGPSALAI